MYIISRISTHFIQMCFENNALWEEDIIFAVFDWLELPGAIKNISEYPAFMIKL